MWREFLGWLGGGEVERERERERGRERGRWKGKGKVKGKGEGEGEGGRVEDWNECRGGPGFDLLVFHFVSFLSFVLFFSSSSLFFSSSLLMPPPLMRAWAWGGRLHIIDVRGPYRRIGSLEHCIAFHIHLASFPKTISTRRAHRHFLSLPVLYNVLPVSSYLPTYLSRISTEDISNPPEKKREAITSITSTAIILLQKKSQRSIHLPLPPPIHLSVCLASHGPSTGPVHD